MTGVGQLVPPRGFHDSFGGQFGTPWGFLSTRRLDRLRSLVVSVQLLNLAERAL
jgi:hypothetical protein